MNRKKTQRLYREEGLAVRRRKSRRRIAVTRTPVPLPDGLNSRWSVDFVHDQLASGRRFRVLNIIDDVTKECLAAVADTSLSGKRVVFEMTTLIEKRGKPGAVISDRRGSANSPGDCWPEEGDRVHVNRGPEVHPGAEAQLALHCPRQAIAVFLSPT